MAHGVRRPGDVGSPAMNPIIGLSLGRILVGLQAPASDRQAFQEFLETLSYPYVEETENPVYRLFLR